MNIYGIFTTLSYELSVAYILLAGDYFLSLPSNGLIAFLELLPLTDARTGLLDFI